MIINNNQTCTVVAEKMITLLLLFLSYHFNNNWQTLIVFHINFADTVGRYEEGA